MQDPEIADVFFPDALVSSWCLSNEWICEAAGQASAAPQPDLEKKQSCPPSARRQQQQAAISSWRSDPPPPLYIHQRCPACLTTYLYVEQACRLPPAATAAAFCHFPIHLEQAVVDLRHV